MTRFFQHFLILFLSATCILGCGPKKSYWAVEEGRIVLDGEPRYFIGTNVWYAAQLALSDPGRLAAELLFRHLRGESCASQLAPWFLSEKESS